MYTLKIKKKNLSLIYAMYINASINTPHCKKPVFFAMSPKTIDVLLDINILEKEM
jgi:hypothetical protein